MFAGNHHPTCRLHDLAVPLQHRLGDVRPAGASILLQPVIGREKALDLCITPSIMPAAQHACLPRSKELSGVPHIISIPGNACWHNTDATHTARRTAEQPSSARRSTAQHSMARHDTAQHSTAQYTCHTGRTATGCRSCGPLRLHSGSVPAKTFGCSAELLQTDAAIPTCTAAPRCHVWKCDGLAGWHSCMLPCQPVAINDLPTMSR